MVFRFLYFWVVLLLCVSAACGQSDDQRTATKIDNAKNQAKELYDITLFGGDWNRMIELTHSSAFESIGKEKYLSEMKKLPKTISENFKSLDVQFGEIRLFEKENGCFSILNRTLKGENIKDEDVLQTGAIVGISSDEGKTWKFLNGKNFSRVFPKLKGQILIPHEKTYIDGVEKQ